MEEDKVTEDVYHYTGNYKNVINILRKRRLLMTDYLYLPGEIHYSLSFLKEKVADKILKFPPANKSIIQSFCYHFCSQIPNYLKKPCGQFACISPAQLCIIGHL